MLAFVKETKAEQRIVEQHEKHGICCKQRQNTPQALSYIQIRPESMFFLKAKTCNKKENHNVVQVYKGGEVQANEPNGSSAVSCDDGKYTDSFYNVNVGVSLCRGGFHNLSGSFLNHQSMALNDLT